MHYGFKKLAGAKIAHLSNFFYSSFKTKMLLFINKCNIFFPNSDKKKCSRVPSWHPAFLKLM